MPLVVSRQDGVRFTTPDDLHTGSEVPMRFMMLMIPHGYETQPPGVMPPAEQVEPMMNYNRSLQQAGILLACEGLHPPSSGARVSFADGKPKVTDGPFAEAKECLGGFWIIDVASPQEAIDWAKKCPAAPYEVIEIRRIQELSDFPNDVQKVLADFPDMQAKKRQQ